MLCGHIFADGKNSNAHISSNILNSNAEGMVDWLNEDDIFILDRRFRDAVKTITEFGCQCEMLAFLKKKRWKAYQRISQKLKACHNTSLVSRVQISLICFLYTTTVHRRLCQLQDEQLNQQMF